MQRERIQITIEVDLDPVPGNFHTPEHWIEHFKHSFKRDEHVFPPHYNPDVYFDFAQYYRNKITNYELMIQDCGPEDTSLIKFYKGLIKSAERELHKHELPF